MTKSEVPKFLVSSRYITVTIAAIVIFSAVFLISYEPFSRAMWFSSTDMVSMLFTLLFYVAAIVILILSRYTMYRLQDRYVITRAQYLCWLVGEVIAITILYTFVTYRYFSQCHRRRHEPGILHPEPGHRLHGNFRKLSG
ncbi:MAG: hypothetical protein IIX38_03240 [Alistipes sp.]|nr:hypothetical protein [Alistipes sp.]